MNLNHHPEVTDGGEVQHTRESFTNDDSPELIAFLKKIASQSLSVSNVTNACLAWIHSDGFAKDIIPDETRAGDREILYAALYNRHVDKTAVSVRLTGLIALMTQISHKEYLTREEKDAAIKFIATMLRYFGL